MEGVGQFLLPPASGNTFLDISAGCQHLLLGPGSCSPSVHRKLRVVRLNPTTPPEHPRQESFCDLTNNNQSTQEQAKVHPPEPIYTIRAPKNRPKCITSKGLDQWQSWQPLRLIRLHSSRCMGSSPTRTKTNWDKLCEAYAMAAPACNPSWLLP